jgi:hypothetical protein
MYFLSGSPLGLNAALGTVSDYMLLLYCETPSFAPMKYKKFWEELIVYFPLIRHRRKENKKMASADTQTER